MRELDTLYLNKRTLNSGYIFVRDENRVKELRRVFDNMKIEYTMYISKKDTCIYGFKVFRIKKQLFELCTQMREVMRCSF